MRKSGPGFFMRGFAMHYYRIIFGSYLFTAVPNFFYKGAGGIVFFGLNTFIVEQFFHCQRGAKCGNKYNIIAGNAIEWHQFLTLGILKEAYVFGEQVGIYLWVVNHFAQQKNSFTGIFIHGAKSNFNGIFHAIAKPKI